MMPEEGPRPPFAGDFGGVAVWSDLGGGCWAGDDLRVGGRRLVLLRGDLYVSTAVCGVFVDDGLQADRFRWLSARFDDLTGDLG